MKLTDMIKLGVKGFKPSDIKQINESGMPTEEVIKLAESGYSVSEVNELISLADKEPEVQPGNNEQNEPSGPAAESSGNEGAGAGNDKELKEKESEIEKLKQQLAMAQQANTQQNLGSSDTHTAEEKVQEIFKTLY